MEIIDGYRGQAHVTPSKVGTCGLGLIGPDSYILSIGNKLSCQTVAGNGIRVLDGAFVIQGRRGWIAPGAYDEVTIENGSQGEYRKDIIVIEYTKDSASGVENFALKVVKGTPASSDPQLPELTTADINTGATLHQEPLYVVTVSDAAIGVPELQMAVMDSMWEMVELDGTADGKKGGWLKKATEKIFAYAHAKTVLWSGTTTLYAKLTEVMNSIAAHKISGDHDGRYYTETEMDAKLNAKAASSHTHDDRYYTETEVDAKFNSHKTSGDHDNRYYTETEIDNRFTSKKVRIGVDMASFSILSNAAYYNDKVVNINAYLRCANDVMNNGNKLYVCAFSPAPKEKTIIPVIDFESGEILMGEVETTGALNVTGKTLAGQRYLMIHASYCI